MTSRQRTEMLDTERVGVGLPSVAAPPAPARRPWWSRLPGWVAAAVVLAGAGLLAGSSGPVDGVRVAALVTGAGWAMVAGTAARFGGDAARRRTAWPAVALAAGHAAAALVPALVPLLLAGWLAAGIALPHGELRSAPRRVVALLAAAGAAAWSAALLVGAGAPPTGWTVLAALGAGAATLVATVPRYRAAAAPGRRTLQWVAAAAVLTTAAAAVLLALDVLVGVPGGPLPWVVGLCGTAPLALALGVWPASAPAGPLALIEAIVAAGLAVLVVAVYLIVVVGLGRIPVGSEREVLVSSIAAALVVAVLALPVRAWLVAAASRVVGRDPSRRDEMASFGARMTRAVPMDELLLQLAESLRATLAPAGAEVWVGGEGVLDRTLAVPDLPARRLELGEHERVVAGRARCGGTRWMSVWLPDLLAEHIDRHGPDAPVRTVPVAHLGELLGMLVLHRPAGADAFTEEDERVLVELARQLGLALHNVELDSALQASLEELRTRNAQLQASRARIVTAADESRRAIERNLHDGAQQHLVALAVKIGLAKVVLDADPAAVGPLLEQLRSEAQSAIGAIRELAHGIYPPLLRERGLGEALRTAALRSPLRCAVEVDLPGRYPAEIEACVYFCCLEAIQNAGKYAGDGAAILVRVDGTNGNTENTGRLRFAVRDDGVGFAGDATEGHGFMNMRDRLGAVGGELDVRSAAGEGTTVSGEVPAEPLAAPGGKIG